MSAAMSRPATHQPHQGSLAIIDGVSKDSLMQDITALDASDRLLALDRKSVV